MEAHADITSGEEQESCLIRRRDGGADHDDVPMTSKNTTQRGAASGRIKLTHGAGKSSSQTSSFILFASIVILINLGSYHDLDLFGPASVREQQDDASTAPAGAFTPFKHQAPISANIRMSDVNLELPDAKLAAPLHNKQVHNTWAAPRQSKTSYLTYLESCLEFVKLMFRQPMRLNRRTTRYTLAEARVLGKMAKVWYIKKKIKKLSKKLKKHTIAVPVFTAIPIYEHSYYPQPHVTHVSQHGAMHHAASSYSPTAAMVAHASSGAGGSAANSLATAASSQQQQLATSASNQHQVAAAHRMAGGAAHPAAVRSSMYSHHHPAAAGSHHHIINAYAPSPPLYVDDAGGLYGHYGNAYGRYDGGYHMW